MYPFRPPVIHRISIPAPDGGEPRRHMRHPHPPSVVEQARVLVETTRFSFQTVADRVRIPKSTVTRWHLQRGWKRPFGACEPRRRGGPSFGARSLAGRLRAQAGRLVHEIENAPAVDPAALALALQYLDAARDAYRQRKADGRKGPRRIRLASPNGAVPSRPARGGPGGEPGAL